MVEQGRVGGREPDQIAAHARLAPPQPVEAADSGPKGERPVVFPAPVAPRRSGRCRVELRRRLWRRRRHVRTCGERFECGFLAFLSRLAHVHGQADKRTSRHELCVPFDLRARTIIRRHTPMTRAAHRSSGQSTCGAIRRVERSMMMRRCPGAWGHCGTANGASSM